jgi:hypothetical protein
MRVVFFVTSAERIPEIMIVLVASSGLFSSHATLLSSLGTDAQGAWCFLGQARSSAVTNKVALIEELDERVFAVARDGAGVADGSRLIQI